LEIGRFLSQVPRSLSECATKDGTATDQAIARRLSEQLTKRPPYLAQLATYRFDASYPNKLPVSLEGRAPLFKQDGMIF
jgi:hypothetical protein